jgi:hypothetical protein
MRWVVGVSNYIEVGSGGLYEVHYGNDHQIDKDVCEYEKEERK